MKHPLNDLISVLRRSVEITTLLGRLAIDDMVVPGVILV